MIRSMLRKTIGSALLAGAAIIGGMLYMGMDLSGDGTDRTQHYDGLPQTDGMVSPLPPVPPPTAPVITGRPNPFPEVRTRPGGIVGPEHEAEEQRRQQTEAEREELRAKGAVIADMRRILPWVQDMAHYAPEAPYPNGLRASEVFKRATELLVYHRDDGSLKDFCQAYIDLRLVHQAAAADYMAHMTQGLGAAGPDMARHNQMLTSPGAAGHCVAVLR